MSFRKFFAAASCAVMLATTLPPSYGCAPGFDHAYFSYSMHPDFPLTKYAQGELGIIEPSYARSYQVVAYRYLTGKPLTVAEQRACVALWKARLLNEDDSLTWGYSPDALKPWLTARKQVTAATVADIDVYRKASTSPDSYGQFENCPRATFDNAIKVLNQRIAKYGTKSEYVKEWLDGQDKVFCHCGSPKYDYDTKITAPEGPFPAPLPENADAQLKADRAYQIAAAHFYGMQYDLAAEEFLAISEDAKSPWQKLGKFMAARCLIRKGTLPDKVDNTSLTKAADLLKQIISDPTLDSLHSTAEGLLSFIHCRGTPESKLTELSQSVLDPSKANDFRQNLCDYTFLFDGFCPEPDAETAPPTKHVAPTMSEVLKRDDLSDWLYSFQINGVSEGQVFEHWQSTHSLPWLIAALSKLKPGDKEAKELLTAAQSIQPSSPAYLTVSFYMIDQLVKSNRKDDAARELAKVLAVNMPPSARNDFVDLQMMVVPTVAEFTKLSARKPAGLFSDFNGNQLPDDADKLIAGGNYPVTKNICFVDEAADIFNDKVPLNLLKEAAMKSNAPTDVHFDLAQAAWTRAVLLKQDDVALGLIPLLKSLKPRFAPFFDDYANAKSPTDRIFAASVFILKNPGARPYVTPGAPREVDYGRIEDYGNNWWDAKGLTGSGAPEDASQPTKSEPAPKFLTAADITAAKGEVKALHALGDAPNILSATVLAYAKAHPTDPRIPEALHRCVKATHFGTRNDKTGAFSRQAFHLLHQRYGSSAWAKQTPYFYGEG